jgi:hypothetical protein
MAGAVLSAHEREQVRVGLEAVEFFTGIARRLYRSPWAVSQEGGRNGCGLRYCAVDAARQLQRVQVVAHHPSLLTPLSGGGLMGPAVIVDFLAVASRIPLVFVVAMPDCHKGHYTMGRHIEPAWSSRRRLEILAPAVGMG